MVFHRQQRLIKIGCLTLLIWCSASLSIAGESFHVYFAEGYTKGEFQTKLFLLNPENEAALTTIRFIPEDGTPKTHTCRVPPESRQVIETEDMMPDAAFAVVLESTAPLAVKRTVEWCDSRSGMIAGHDSPAILRPSKTWYLAEGYNSENHATYLVLFNPGETKASVTLTCIRSEGEAVRKTVILPPQKRLSLVTKAWIPQGGFSVIVESDVPILLERTMYWEVEGIQRAGGHNTAASPELAQTWYLAEGYTRDGTETFLHLLNPQPDDAHATLTFFQEDGTSLSLLTTLPAASRQTLRMSNVLSNTGFATRIMSDRPILVERSQYWNAWTLEHVDGHNSLASSRLDTRWYLPEGDTRGQAETMLIFMNPAPRASAVTLRFLSEHGEIFSHSMTLQPESRRTMVLRAIVPEHEFGTVVTSELPILVETTIFRDGGGLERAAGYNSPGVAHHQMTVSSQKHPSVQEYRVTVSKTGTGGGSVTGQGIDCGRDCTEMASENSVLNVQAVPDHKSRFAGWLVDGNPVTAPLPVSSAFTITAIFEKREE